MFMPHRAAFSYLWCANRFPMLQRVRRHVKTQIFWSFLPLNFWGRILKGKKVPGSLCHSAFVSKVKWQLTDPPSQYHSRCRRRCPPPPLPSSPPPSPPPPPRSSGPNLSISQTIAASLWNCPIWWDGTTARQLQACNNLMPFFLLFSQEWHRKGTLKE